VDVLDQSEIKRNWESGNHPYLFFNEDESAFTPLGFFVEAKHGGYNLLVSFIIINKHFCLYQINSSHPPNLV